MTETTQQRDRLLVADSATRKTYPMFSGLLAYFPDALAYVAWVSHIGNEKHNPGEPLHHVRGKSMDHADCIARHLTRHGQFDGEVRESGALAWRALALLQEELEKANGFPLPRGARGPVTEGGAPVVPAAGGYVEVKQRPGESMSEAICRTALYARKFERAVDQRKAHNADPKTRHGGIPVAGPREVLDPEYEKPETRHGFTIGEIVETVAGDRGPVVGFEGFYVLVNAGSYPRGGWMPENLKRVPLSAEYKATELYGPRPNVPWYRT
jgi:hypothetical protein